MLATCFDVHVEQPPSDGGDPPEQETVFFSIDILPLFQLTCIHCHGGAGGLDLESYEGLLAGGTSGALVIPGVPENSTLIRRLNGDLPPTMPLDGPALPSPDVDRIAQWILEGARDN